MSRQRKKALCSYHSQNSGYKNNLQIWRQTALTKHPDWSHSVFFVVFLLTATQTSFSKPVVWFGAIKVSNRFWFDFPDWLPLRRIFSSCWRKSWSERNQRTVLFCFCFFQQMRTLGWGGGTDDFLGCGYLLETFGNANRFFLQRKTLS